MTSFRYWRTNGQLHLHPPGIRIVHDEPNGHYVYDEAAQDVVGGAFPNDFSGAVRDNLNYIYATTVGQTVLNHLAVAVPVTTIQPATFGNAIQMMGPNHVKPFAMELHAYTPGAQTRAAVRTMIQNQPFILGSALLARAVRSTPRWSLQSPPELTDVANMSWTQLLLRGQLTAYGQYLRTRVYQQLWGWDTNEGYFEEDLWISGRRGTATRGIYITQDEMQEWLIGRIGLPGRLSAPEKEHVVNVIIATLYQHGINGNGLSVSIEWRHQANYEMNSRRPPAIGLGHELIHAYYATQGQNPGYHDSDPTVLMFEYLCVGLGPFANHPVTENRMRAQWNMALPHIPPVDMQNHKTPPRRISYL